MTFEKLVSKIEEKYKIDEIHDEDDHSIKVVNFSNYMCEVSFDNDNNQVEFKFNVHLDPNDAVAMFRVLVGMLDDVTTYYTANDGFRRLEDGDFEYDEQVTRKEVYDLHGNLKYPASQIIDEDE